jgi:hypothetical protein
MYLIDPETTFKFGIKKIEGKYFPVQIKDDTEIKEGQVIFQAKAYTAKEVIKHNGLTELEKYDFIQARTKCNVSTENMVPAIWFSVNYFVLGLSVITEEDEKLFM